MQFSVANKLVGGLNLPKNVWCANFPGGADVLLGGAEPPGRSLAASRIWRQEHIEMHPIQQRPSDRDQLDIHRCLIDVDPRFYTQWDIYDIIDDDQFFEFINRGSEHTPRIMFKFLLCIIFSIIS